MAERNLAVVQSASPATVTETEWSEARKRFVLENYCNDAPEAVALVFVQESMRRGLSPEARQVYLIPRQDHGATKWTTQTSIDGYRVIADRTRRYAGSDDAIFTYDDKGVLERATVTVWKLVEHQRCPFTATAYLSEYKGNTPTWGKMPRVMLAKCAESLALRKAFPAELSGIYTDAEMDQADVIDATHSVTVSERSPRAIDAPKEVGAGVPLRDAKKTLWEMAQSKGLTKDLLDQYAEETCGEAPADMALSGIVQLTQKLKREGKDELLDRLTNRPAEVIDAGGDMFPDVPEIKADPWTR